MKLSLVALVLSFSLMSFVTVAKEESTIPDEVKALMDDATPNAKVFREDMREHLTQKGGVVGIQELPMKKLFFVEADKGYYIVSSDGRFVFEGKLVDVWHRKTIKDLEGARQIQRTPISNIGFKPEEQFAHFTVGNPNLPRQGVAFVDPTSLYTQTFLKHLLATPEKFNWTVVLLPLVGGEPAKHRARRLWCAKDKEAALLDLANGTEIATTDLVDSCSEEPIIMATLLVDLFQITQLPHLIREDGLKMSGYPVKFDEWLAQP